MSKHTSLKGMEQSRASYAFQCAKDVKENLSADIAKAYKAYVRSLPMMIKTNGLGAALTFVFAKKSDDKKSKSHAYLKIYQQIEVYAREFTPHLIQLGDDSDLIQEVINLNSPEYRALTVEILAFLTWLRRFADGLIEDENPSTGGSND